MATGTPAENRQAIEARFNSGTQKCELSDLFTGVDRAPRLVSGCQLLGPGPESVKLENVSSSGVFGDSASLQCLQDHDPWIGYADAYAVLGARDRIRLIDQSQNPNYLVNRLVWTWKWNGGVTSDYPVLSVIKARQADMIQLDPAPKPASDAVCWVADGRKATVAHEGMNQLKLYDPVGTNWIGQMLLISDGQTVANEAVGELRLCTNAQGSTISLDRALTLDRYRRASLVVAPVNVVRDVVIRGLTLGAGPIQWSFFGKWLHNLTFENVRFNGVCELVQCSGVRFTHCTFDGGLKLNASGHVEVNGCQARRISLEERCYHVSFDGIELHGIGGLPGISTDPFSYCERISLTNSQLLDVADFPFCLEGRECRVENTRVAGATTSAACYISGDRSVMTNIDANRALCFQSGYDQFGKNLRAPQVHLAWPGGSPSTGVGVNLGPNVTNHGGWVVY